MYRHRTKDWAWPSPVDNVNFGSFVSFRWPFWCLPGFITNSFYKLCYTDHSVRKSFHPHVKWWLRKPYTLVSRLQKSPSKAKDGMKFAPYQQLGKYCFASWKRNVNTSMMRNDNFSRFMLREPAWCLQGSNSDLNLLCDIVSYFRTMFRRTEFDPYKERRRKSLEAGLVSNRRHLLVSYDYSLPRCNSFDPFSRFASVRHHHTLQVAATWHSFQWLPVRSRSREYFHLRGSCRVQFQTL